MDLETVDRLLTTTRAVRRRLDLGRPVEPEVLERCLEIAVQAPTAGVSQGWRFVIVTDRQKKAVIADVYRRAREQYQKAPPEFLRRHYADPGSREQVERMRRSGDHLAAHLGDVPVLVLACIEGRIERDTVFAQATLYGSILPAAWSFMLALRARGLGAAWTTDHLVYEEEVARLLEIPPGVTQGVLLAVAYFVGSDFRPASRRPARELTYWNAWGVDRVPHAERRS